MANTTFFFQKTIKARLVVLGRYLLITHLLCLIGCSHRGDELTDNPLWSDPLLELVVPYEATTLLPDKGLVTHKGQPLSGVRVDYYDNDTLALRESYLDGVKHGETARWYDTGIKSYEAYYQRNKLNGTVTAWWPTGKKRSESIYSLGVLDGVQWQWYQSGAKFKQARFDQGVPSGLQRSWRENGKLYNNYEIVEGRVFGLKKASLCYTLDEEVIQYE